MSNPYVEPGGSGPQGYLPQGRPPQGYPQQGPGVPAGYPSQGYPPAGYPPQGPGMPAGAGVVGKRRNPFAVWIGLPIITLGIYGLVWIYKTNKELNEYDRRIAVNPALSVLAFFPGFFLIIPPFVAAWRVGTRVQAAQRAAGVPECSPGLAFVLWLFIFGTGPLYLQLEINKIWDRYPGAMQGQQVPLYA
jgi:Domain of unknown function (DUF4234)